MMKEIKDNANKWKGNPHSWIRKINTVKMSTLPKAIYKFSAIPTKYQWYFLSQNLSQNNPRICMKPQRTPNSQRNPRKKNKAGIPCSQISNYTTYL